MGTAGAVSEGELRAFAAQSLADFKLPKRIVFVNTAVRDHLAATTLASLLKRSPPTVTGVGDRPGANLPWDFVLCMR